MKFTKTGEKDDRIRLSDGRVSAWFEFLDSVAFDGHEYMALLEDGIEDALILRVSVTPDGEIYETIEDDEEFERARRLLEEE